MEILFVFAMKSEFMHLLEKFPERTEEKIGEYTLYKTKYGKNIIYFLHSKIGSLNTSISLTKTLNKIKPDIIINAGTSGGHDKNLNVGDFILAKDVINSNEIETNEKELNKGSNSLEWELNTFYEEEKEKDFEGRIKIYNGDKDLIEKIKIIGISNNFKPILEGRVSSGDIWNKEEDRIKLFNDKYSTLCEEMELYSVYKICDQEKIPCIGIKIISNNAMNGQKYDITVTKTLDEFLYAIIQNISE